MDSVWARAHNPTVERGGAQTTEPASVSNSEPNTWRVMLAKDDIKVMSRAQLDDAYRLSIIDDDTAVWGPGMKDWQALGVALSSPPPPASPPPPVRSAPPPPLLQGLSSPPRHSAPPPRSAPPPVRSSARPPPLLPSSPPCSAPPAPVLAPPPTLSSRWLPPPRSTPPPPLLSAPGLPFTPPQTSPSSSKKSIRPPPILVPTHPPAAPSKPTAPLLVRSTSPSPAFAPQLVAAPVAAIAAAPATAIAGASIPMAPPSSLPPVHAQKLFTSLPAPASFESPPAPRRRRSRAGIWLVALMAVVGVFVILYRNHTLLAGARALSLEGRYLSIERAVVSRLNVLSRLSWRRPRDEQMPAAAPAPPATSTVRSSGDTALANTGSIPSSTAPTPERVPAPEAKPSGADEETGSSQATKELTAKESQPASSRRLRASRSGRPVQPASATKGKSAPDVSDDEETPKSRLIQTVRLDEEEEQPQQRADPNSLWPTKTQKASAGKSRSSTASKESAEAPKVESKLEAAMRAASQK